ncbi:hypothetical protein [Streptomyces sp. NBC_01803]|uniref:hypothetical protein n=1 Tax=Streptomyces sp. NBC_01803 TaxID=2975946 RepID=UPI002DDADD88|nr:hypothetical protein [Streptomyces sp. NBC_01803]WSA45132.1 hypothetical protein OIE51_13500 [Streptomyces sp. NBC_01803]
MSPRRTLRLFLARRAGEVRRHLAASLLTIALVVLIFGLIGYPLATLAAGMPTVIA